MLAHNIQLSRYDRALRQLEHPLNTSRVTSKKDVLGFSMSNGCDYFVGELRRYSGSSQEIEAFYASQPAHGSPLESIEFLFIEDGMLPEDTYLPYTVDTLAEWGVPSPGPGEKLYIVYYWTFGDAHFDYRCR
jgi:hypothetical protein